MKWIALNNIKLVWENISKEKSNFIKSLETDETIQILPADKGNAIVVLNAVKDNNRKVNNVLMVGKYTLLNEDPAYSLEN